MNSGIYSIVCVETGKRYIGSSKNVARRWSQHRTRLNAGKSPCRHLQGAWTKYGSAAFSFSWLERCPEDQLEALEQHWVDVMRPALNILTDIRRRNGPEMLARRAASVRARAAQIVHCPMGHRYTTANTYLSKANKRVCRECNKVRVRRVYEGETSEAREIRRANRKAFYEANKPALVEQMRVYAATRKDEKREYDRRRRERIKKYSEP